jgi:hypothetical protein
MKVAIADVAEAPLGELGKTLVEAAGEGNVLVVPTDVAKLEEVVRLRDKVYEAWGEVRIVIDCLVRCLLPRALDHTRRGLVLGAAYHHVTVPPLYLHLHLCLCSVVVGLGCGAYEQCERLGKGFAPGWNRGLAKSL